jgi:hypothetical protein
MSGAAFRRSVDVFLARSLSPQQQSAALAQTAKAGLAELIRSGQGSERYRRIVDGREGAAEEAVRPDGVIVYRFDRLAEAAAFALNYLQERSPRDSGDYRSSFYLGLDGRFVPASRFNPATMGQVDEIVIGNTQPYSRKLDVQLVGGQSLRVSMPPGIFSDAAAAVRRRFGNSVTAKRVYTMRFPGQYVIRSGRNKGRPVESPALVISAR